MKSLLLVAVVVLAFAAIACGGEDAPDVELVEIERLDLAGVELSAAEFVDPPFADQYPEVVATVNGEEVTGKTLASRQVGLEIDRRGIDGLPDVFPEAHRVARLADIESTDPLEAAVDEVLLRQAANRLGYEASEESIADYLSDQHELLGPQSDREMPGRDEMEAVARKLGYSSWLDWTTSDEAIEAHSFLVGVQQLRQEHCDPLPTPTQPGFGTTERECAAFLEDERSRAEIVYFVRWAD